MRLRQIFKYLTNTNNTLFKIIHIKHFALSGV